MSHKILQGDWIAVLKTLESESAHSVVTSPPYWGLRDYGNGPTIWPTLASRGIVRCNNGDHLWGDVLPIVLSSGLHRMPENQTGGTKDYSIGTGKDHGCWCQLCGAWRGCLGLEPTPEMYVEHIVAGFREMRRVLRNDGTLWLNLGDCYATGAGKVGECPGGGDQGERWKGYRGTREAGANGKQEYLVQNMGPLTQPNRMPLPGLKPKDLVGIPWRVAFALQADGWYLRSDIIWAKPNPMPESVTDRPTKAHEYLFLLTKSERYYYDAEAIKEPQAPGTFERFGEDGKRTGDGPKRANSPNGLIRDKATYNCAIVPGGRNKRTVWTIATQPFPEAHFATFPEDLVMPCILAGTSEKGVCAKCGAPWERITESETRHESGSGRAGNRPNGKGAGGTQVREDHDIRMGPVTETKTLGWRPTCSCGTEETKRSVVLDPFAGSGTVGLVARLNHCDFLGIELNPEYCSMAERRLGQEVFSF